MGRDYKVYYGPAIVCGRVYRKTEDKSWGCPRFHCTHQPGKVKFCPTCGLPLADVSLAKDARIHPDEWVGEDVFQVVPSGGWDHFQNQEILICNLREDPFGLRAYPQENDFRIDPSHYNKDGLLRDFEKKYAREIAILNEKTGEAHVVWGLFVWAT